VHRTERVAALAGVRVGTPIDPDLIARVLAHPSGGLKNRPPRARVIPLVNKVEDEAQLRSAREIASYLLRYEAIDAVAVGAVRNAALPVAELHRRVAAVVLAAGGSTRMQGPLKQLLPWGASTLVRHTVEVANRSQVAETIVVVGKQAEEVRQELEGTGARIVLNPDWEQGRSTSVRTGLRALSPNTAAAVFINADQPFLTAPVIDTIIQRHAETLAPLVVPVYNGETGSPVLFAQKLFEELGALHAEYGGKTLIRAHRDQVARVNILDTRAALDVDTPEEYRAARAQSENR